ncbi:hypothetical protein DOTSEDRAFT_31573 [Dothistroma septosporum NZE10]|uniref:Uncharacterized protein n=1 Tax=Dothistroma septosporum (strain NZE10 / CBS 128990) TaxID=675120 RepID=N1PVW6_DOTSN|nr:hypothetical protein DOTSEDRAFT_31573 [Dothistroma septosporum NZE10]
MSTKTTPEKVDKAYVLAHQYEENFHHRGKNVFARGLPALTTQTRCAVYGPGAAQWKIDARAHQQALAGTAAAATVTAQPPAPMASASNPQSSDSLSRAAFTSQLASSPTPYAAPAAQRASETRAPPRVLQLSPPSPRADTQLEIDNATLRTLHGARIQYTRSDSSSLSSLSQSPELPTELETSLADARTSTTQDSSPFSADGIYRRGRSEHISNIEAQRAGQQVANPRPIAPLKKKRTPRPAPSPRPSMRLDDDGIPYRSDKHTMLREQFRSAFTTRASTAGGKLISRDVDYAVPMLHQPEIARQALTKPPPKGYTGPVAGPPTRIALPGGNENPKIRAAQLSIGDALLAHLEKEAAAEAAGDEDVGEEGIEADGEMAEEEGDPKDARVVPDSDTEEEELL